MSTLALTPALRREYENLFATCQIRPERLPAVEALIDALHPHESRYRAVAAQAGIPWFFVALVHNMESGMRFDRHLHNGDPLTARTVQVPAGRPRRGQPPFSWEDSAADALSLRGFTAQTDWTLAGTLYQLERYNGWGYRRFHPEVLSPYLWSFSNHYRTGKYVADGTWSDTAVSKQCGAAVLMRRMAEHGLIQFAAAAGLPPTVAPAIDAEPGPLVPSYATTRPDDPQRAAQVESLQRWLDSFPDIFLKVDGIAGPRTAAAYRRVTGHALPGAPE